MKLEWGKSKGRDGIYGCRAICGEATLTITTFDPDLPARTLRIFTIGADGEPFAVEAYTVSEYHAKRLAQRLVDAMLGDKN